MLYSLFDECLLRFLEEEEDLDTFFFFFLDGVDIVEVVASVVCSGTDDGVDGLDIGVTIASFCTSGNDVSETGDKARLLL